METQSNEPRKTTVNSRGFFTTVNNVKDAEKPIKSISTLFKVLGWLCVIGGICVAILSFNKENVELNKGLITFSGIASATLGAVFIYFASKLRKEKDITAARILMIGACVWLVMACINVKIIAIFLGLLALFSRIEAIRILKQLENIKSEEDTEKISDNL
jgi:hypothetical protein